VIKKTLKTALKFAGYELRPVSKVDDYRELYVHLFGAKSVAKRRFSNISADVSSATPKKHNPYSLSGEDKSLVPSTAKKKRRKN